MHVSVVTRSDDMVGFSNRRGAPGHQRTVFLTGSVNHHVRGWTWLCEERNTVGGDVFKSALTDLDLNNLF